MSTLADLLMYYNKIDVTPGITALKTMISFYKEERNVDMLKSAISLPGISRKLLFRPPKNRTHISIHSVRMKKPFTTLSRSPLQADYHRFSIDILRRERLS